MEAAEDISTKDESITPCALLSNEDGFISNCCFSNGKNDSMETEYPMIAEERDTEQKEKNVSCNEANTLETSTQKLPNVSNTKSDIMAPEASCSSNFCDKQLSFIEDLLEQSSVQNNIDGEIELWLSDSDWSIVTETDCSFQPTSDEIEVWVDNTANKEFNVDIATCPPTSCDNTLPESLASNFNHTCEENLSDLQIDEKPISSTSESLALISNQVCDENISDPKVYEEPTEENLLLCYSLHESITDSEDDDISVESPRQLVLSTSDEHSLSNEYDLILKETGDSDVAVIDKDILQSTQNECQNEPAVQSASVSNNQSEITESVKEGHQLDFSELPSLLKSNEKSSEVLCIDLCTDSSTDVHEDLTPSRTEEEFLNNQTLFPKYLKPFFASCENLEIFLPNDELKDLESLDSAVERNEHSAIPISGTCTSLKTNTSESNNFDSILGRNERSEICISESSITSKESISSAMTSSVIETEVKDFVGNDPKPEISILKDAVEDYPIESREKREEKELHVNVEHLNEKQFLVKNDEKFMNYSESEWADINNPKWEFFKRKKVEPCLIKEVWNCETLFDPKRDLSKSNYRKNRIEKQSSKGEKPKLARKRKADESESVQPKKIRKLYPATFLEDLQARMLKDKHKAAVEEIEKEYETKMKQLILRHCQYVNKLKSVACTFTSDICSASELGKVTRYFYDAMIELKGILSVSCDRLDSFKAKALGDRNKMYAEELATILDCKREIRGIGGFYESKFGRFGISKIDGSEAQVLWQTHQLLNCYKYIYSNT